MINFKKCKLLGIILTGIILAGCSASSNQITSRPPLKTEVKALTKEEIQIEELIKKLGDDEWQIREQAQQELIKMGKNIKPLLKKYENSIDPEVRIRIKQIIEEISPTKTLIMTPMDSSVSTSKILKDIEKIEGIKVINVEYKSRDSVKRFYMLVTIRGDNLVASLDSIRNIIKESGFEEEEKVPEGWQ